MSKLLQNKTIKYTSHCVFTQAEEKLQNNDLVDDNQVSDIGVTFY